MLSAWNNWQTICRNFGVTIVLLLKFAFKECLFLRNGIFLFKHLG